MIKTDILANVYRFFYYFCNDNQFRMGMKNTKALSVVMLIVAAILFAGCTPEESNNTNTNWPNNGNQINTAIPKVRTSEVYDVTATQAYCKGEITSQGESAVIERGLCWSTEVRPTVNDDHVLDSLGLDVFTCVMTDLLPATTYYVRAYAVNSEGVGYGGQVCFTTLEAPEPLSEAGFVGVWGVEQLDYYNTDYNGEPIPATLETYYFVPGDLDGGIDMIFREDQTGELIDRSLDSLSVKTFAYLFNESDSSLNLIVQTPSYHAYILNISEMTDDSFVYLNEYADNYIEKAYLKRLSYDPEKSKSTNTIISDKPSKKGPLFNINR